MIDAIACIGLGYKGPTFHALRTNLLEESKKELQLLVDTYQSSWEDYGCTIMGDGWKYIRQRSLINFLVYTPKGISFIKSVDASDLIFYAQTLCNLFAEIVEIVGCQYVVHMITDNAANYKAAGRLLNEKYPNIMWTPCATHCLNLMLKDIAKMPHIENLAQRASSNTVFVYNHKWTLGWLRNIKGWIEILRLGDTRFATTFIDLKSLHDHKCDLQAMITSRYFLVVKIVSPLVRLLRIVDSDERPSLGYVYKGMIRANKAIKETFKYVRRLYQPYISILEKIWERQLWQDIHAAAFWNFNKSNSLDPIDYECIDKIDSWAVENEPSREPELNLDEFENMVAQQEEGQEQRGGQNEDTPNCDDEDVLVVQDGINFSSFDINQGNEGDEIHGNDDNE
ncbi:uncharacterized protein LOC120265161 [Dioscorea cayenensis subsp. rotundata]|uniref:Uncharacterized protein LOC120265161 n=1 Tax=Dioscorea cayennensis subsp. rotundata TaxID=55577 RepID=A0AB40BNF1_DIOCR|nr:uncharacterized protein LOC120265161 [Dioscorea cayenensis subsp. rotundata]